MIFIAMFCAVGLFLSGVLSFRILIGVLREIRRFKSLSATPDQSLGVALLMFLMATLFFTGSWRIAETLV